MALKGDPSKKVIFKFINMTPEKFKTWRDTVEVLSVVTGDDGKLRGTYLLLPKSE